MTPEEAIEELVRACPSLEPEWRAYLGEEYPAAFGGPQERLPYVDVGGVSRLVVDCVADGRHQEVTSFFSALEQLYGREPALLNFLTIGVLESIQNIALGRHIELAVFHPWLGRRTLQEWKSLVVFWQGGSSHVGPNEDGGD